MSENKSIGSTQVNSELVALRKSVAMPLIGQHFPEMSEDDKERLYAVCLEFAIAGHISAQNYRGLLTVSINYVAQAKRNRKSWLDDRTHLDVFSVVEQIATILVSLGRGEGHGK